VNVVFEIWQLLYNEEIDFAIELCAFELCTLWCIQVITMYREN